MTTNQSGDSKRLGVSRRDLFLAALFVQLVVGGLGVWYLLTTPAVNPAQAQPLVREVLVPEDTVYPDADLAKHVGKALPPVDIAKAVAGTPAQVKAGAALFAAHCVSCHGEKGHGDGPVGVTLQPRPRNLTDLPTWKNGTRLSDIFRTVTNGLPGTRMAAFDYLSPEDRFALAHYVKSLASGHAADTQASLAELDKQFQLSKGGREPSTIPVAVAMEKLIAESAPPKLPSTPKSENEQGMELFRSLTLPEKRAGIDYWLSQDRSWTDNLERLQRLVLAGLPGNGFRVETALLDRAGWMALHDYLRIRYAGGGAQIQER